VRYTTEPICCAAKEEEEEEEEEERKGRVLQELGFGYLLPCLYSLILSLIAARSGGDFGGLRVRYCMLARFILALA